MIKKIIIFSVPIFIGTLVFLDQIFNFQFVNLKSADLSVIAFGYNYKSKPFTGFIYNKNKNSSIDKIIFLVKGLRHGPEIYWYENGQRWVERNFKLGTEDGLQKIWHPDGKPFSLKNFKDGQPDGDFFEWFKDGRISSYVKYENGVEVAAKTWTGQGKPFYNYTWKNNERVGLLGDRYCTKIK